MPDILNKSLLGKKIMEESQTRAHGSDLRKGRCSIPGHAYLITTVTKDRQHTFKPHANAQVAARCIYDPDVVCHAYTWAYVIMPDHVHWLMQLTEHAQLAKAVRLYKSKVSMQIGRPVWQRGYHDRALRKQDDAKAISRYIVANPLRAHLVDNVGDYPYWNVIWLTDN